MSTAVRPRSSTAGRGAPVAARLRSAISRILSRSGRWTAPFVSAITHSSSTTQSSAPPLDLAYLWSQESDRLSVYRDADLMDAESDLTNAALNAWATTATAGSLLTPESASGGEATRGASIVGTTPLQVGRTHLGVIARRRARDDGRPIADRPSVRLPSPATGHPDGSSLDGESQSVVDQVLRDCHLSSRVWTVARDLRKYGDQFLEVVVDEGLKVRRLKTLPPAEIVRREDEYGRLQPVAFQQIRNGVPVASFAAWQVVHLRNNRQGDEKYGRSGLRTARRAWRMLGLLEDSMVSARLTRAYTKLVHFLPVTDGATQQERQQTIQEYSCTMTRRQLINPESGQLEERDRPYAVNTDFYVTVSPSDSSKTGVQSLDPANNQLSNIVYVEYLQNLVVAGLEVPKAYLGLERDINAKATLGYQEIQFLRMAGSLQAQLEHGFRTVFELALTLAGIDPASVLLTFQWGGQPANE